MAKIKKDEGNDVGYITQAVGPIVDVCFSNGNLPEVLTALVIPLKNGGKLVTEIEQHVGDDTVRSVAMGPTDGLVRGMKVINTHKCIEVPVGDATLGRMFNVLGEPIDSSVVSIKKEGESVNITFSEFSDFYC